MSSAVMWDPDPVAVVLPWLHHPIRWYGLCFTLGFIVAYFLVTATVRHRSRLRGVPLSRQQAFSLVDRLTWFVILGTLVGARLGHVFFYDWPLYRQHPVDIFKIWEGGLASHGGALGVIAALLCFRKLISKEFPWLTYVDLLDCLAAPTALAGAFIRLGNFFNQEIVGTPTAVPWAVFFGHPAEGIPVPRHPVQLYEAACYVAIFVLLYFLTMRVKSWSRPGMAIGSLFVLLFSARFFMEFYKEVAPSSLIADQSLFSVGQWLSVPFILLGCGLWLSAFLSRGQSLSAAHQVESATPKMGPRLPPCHEGYNGNASLLRVLAFFRWPRYTEHDSNGPRS